MQGLIETERLYVRYLTAADLDVYYQLNGSAAVMQYIRAPKSREETAAFLQQVIASYTTEPHNLRLALVEKSTNNVIGTFAIIPIEGTTDIQLGYALLESYWGKGLATEITAAGIRYAFDVLQLPHIDGVVEKPNIASQKVLLKNGFVVEKEYVEDSGREMLLFRRKK
jgi:RimJ/RimL family protein N-acetyltransferase